MRWLERTDAIIVTQDFLQKIETILKRKLNITEYTAAYTCESLGDKPQSCTTYSELEDFDNCLDRRIEAMHISVKSKTEDDVYFDLHIGYCSENVSGPMDIQQMTVSGTIHGSEKQETLIYNDIDYQIRKVSRNWLYTIISKTGVMYSLAVAALFVGMCYFFFGLPTHFSIPVFGIHTPYDTSTFWGLFFQYASAIFYGLMIAIVLHSPVQEIFPRTVFIVGDSVKNMRRTSQLKEKVFWNILVGIFVNIAGAFLYAYLFT